MSFLLTVFLMIGLVVGYLQSSVECEYIQTRIKHKSMINYWFGK